MVLRFLAMVVLLAGCANGNLGETQTVIYPAGPRLLLAGGNGKVGRLDLVPLAGGVTKPIAILPIHMDASIRSFARFGKTIVINRMGMDSLYVLNKGVGKVVNQLSLSAGINPQEVLMPDAETVLVTQRNSGEILEWNLLTGQKTGHSIAGFAFEKGVPDMTAVTEVNGKVWVALQRLKDQMHPVGTSQVLQWDRAAKRFSPFDLETKNPVTTFKRDPDGNVYLGCAGKTGMDAALDGAIERLAPAGRSEKAVIREADLKGELIDFEILDRNRGVALISKPQTALVLFDVGRGKVTQTLKESAGYHFVRLALDRAKGRLYVSDINRTRPTLRVFRTDTLAEEPEIALTLPVFEMEIEEP